MIKQVWQTEDGKVFENYHDAEKHVVDENGKKEKLYQDFLSRYNGKELLKKHSLFETGLWEVKGEDENADLFGSHHQPYLGTLEGRLEDVIREAVTMSQFWSWGAGGSIRKVEIKKV